MYYIVLVKYFKKLPQKEHALELTIIHIEIKIHEPPQQAYEYLYVDYVHYYH